MIQFHALKLTSCFFLLTFNVSSDKVCFKLFDFTYMSIVRLCTLRINESRLFQFSPRLFGSPNVHSTLRSLSKEVFSHLGSTLVNIFYGIFLEFRHFYFFRQASRISYALLKAFCSWFWWHKTPC